MPAIIKVVPMGSSSTIRFLQSAFGRESLATVSDRIFKKAKIRRRTTDPIGTFLVESVMRRASHRLHLHPEAPPPADLPCEGPSQNGPNTGTNTEHTDHNAHIKRSLLERYGVCDDCERTLKEARSAESCYGSACNENSRSRSSRAKD